MTFCRRTFLAGVISLGAASGALAQSGRAAQFAARAKALVVSFGYADTPRNYLPNTLADGRLIVATMRRLNFASVTTVLDEAPVAVLAQIGAYVNSLVSGDVAVLYFAGHGVQIADENLLILPGGQQFLSLRSLIDAVRAKTSMVIFFLDACRNNPFAQLPETGQVSRALARSGSADSFQTVSLTDLAGARGGPPSGLRAFSLQGSGVKIVFSTDPSNVALDGATPASINSPFATALAQRLLERRSLDDIISTTTGDVLGATGGAQSPWSQGSIDRPIFLAGPPVRRNPARPPFQIPG